MKGNHITKDGLSESDTVVGNLSQLQVSSSSKQLSASLASDGTSPAPLASPSESREIITISDEEPLDLGRPFAAEQTRRSSGSGRRRRSTDFVPHGYQIRGGRILFNKHREQGAMFLMEWHRKPGCTTWPHEQVVAQFFPIEAKEYSILH